MGMSFLLHSRSVGATNNSHLAKSLLVIRLFCFIFKTKVFCSRASSVVTQIKGTQKSSRRISQLDLPFVEMVKIPGCHIFSGCSSPLAVSLVVAVDATADVAVVSAAQSLVVPVDATADVAVVSPAQSLVVPR